MTLSPIVYLIVALYPSSEQPLPHCLGVLLVGEWSYIQMQQRVLSAHG